MTVVVHHHIFKNAGTTIDWILQHNFRHRVLYIEADEPGGRLRPERVRAVAAGFPKHRAVSSHSFPLPRPDEAWAAIHLTVLRDPIDRYRSIYRFERSRETRHPVNAAARSTEFSAFCRWWLENAPGIWLNWQTRCCTPQATSATSAKASRLTGWEADLEAALGALRGTTLAVTVDRFDQGVVVLEERLLRRGVAFDASYLRQNESAKEASLDLTLESGSFQRLAEQNSLDYALLREARKALDEEYQRIDPSGARLADFRRRCKRLRAPGRRPPVQVPGESDWIVIHD